MATAIIKYGDWLLKKRGKIEPKVGDKIKTKSTAGDNKIFKNNIISDIEQVEIITYFSKYPFELYYGNVTGYIEDCWVEIEMPEIEWDFIDKSTIRGGVGYLDVASLYLQLNETWSLEDNSGGGLFEGTLEECKTKATQLLWKI